MDCEYPSLPGTVNAEADEALDEAAYRSEAQIPTEEAKDEQEQAENEGLLSEEELKDLLGRLEDDDVVAKLVEAAQAKNKRMMAGLGAVEAMLSLAEEAFAEEKKGVETSFAARRGMLALECVLFMTKNEEGTLRAVQDTSMETMTRLLQDKGAGQGQARDKIWSILGTMAFNKTHRKKKTLPSLVSHGTLSLLCTTIVEAARPSSLLSSAVHVLHTLTMIPGWASAMSAQGKVFKTVADACIEEGALSESDLSKALRILWNASNRKELVRDVEAGGGIDVALNVMRKDGQGSSGDARAAVGILHNLARFSILTHTHKHGDEVLRVLARVGSNPAGSVSFVANITAALMVGGLDDKDHQAVVRAGQCLHKLCSALSSTLKGRHCFGGLWEVGEVVQGMQSVAVNDENKRVLREEGALPLLEEALHRSISTDETAWMCVQTLLLLSFDQQALEWMGRRLKEKGTLWADLRALAAGGEQGMTEMSRDAGSLLFRLRDYGGPEEEEEEEDEEEEEEGRMEESDKEKDDDAVRLQVSSEGATSEGSDEMLLAVGALEAMNTNMTKQKLHVPSAEFLAHDQPQALKESSSSASHAISPPPPASSKAAGKSAAAPARMQLALPGEEESISGGVGGGGKGPGGDGNVGVGHKSGIRKKKQKKKENMATKQPRQEQRPSALGGGDGKHVMLSYAWAQKPLVKQLAAGLRSMGVEVWRDEEGSAFSPPISGSTLEAMATAIEHAYAVVVCVSRAYRESGNCRLEAEYAHGFKQRGDLKMLYVMCEADYTTVSKPDRLTGWLGIMIGAELWYPCWGEPEASNAARAIHGKLVPDRPTASTVPTSSPPPVQAGTGSVQHAENGGSSVHSVGATREVSEVQRRDMHTHAAHHTQSHAQAQVDGVSAGAHQDQPRPGEVAMWLAGEGLETCAAAFEHSGLVHMRDVLELDVADVRALLHWSVGLQKQLIRALKKLKGSHLHNEAIREETIHVRMLELERKVASLQMQGGKATSACCVVS